MFLAWACAGREVPESKLIEPDSNVESARSQSQSLSAKTVDSNEWNLGRDIQIGDWVVLRSKKTRFVPLHQNPSPSFLYGTNNGAVARITNYDSARQWYEVRLGNMTRGWVLGRNIARIVMDREAESSSKSAIHNKSKEGAYRRQPQIGADSNADLILGPMIGHTSATSTRIWVKASSAARLSIVIGENEDLQDGLLVQGAFLTQDSDFIGIVDINELRPSTRYYYNILINDQPSMLSPYPFFETAPPQGRRGRMRFAFISCVGKPRAANPAWRDLANVSIDILLQLGDNHYANSTKPMVQRAAYYAHRALPGFREITRRTPTLGIWDDHDFATNDSDRTAKGKEKSLQRSN